MASQTARYLLLIGIIFLFVSSNVFACVGKTLYVGALDTAEDAIMAEFLVHFINARTGSSVKVKIFKDTEDLYKALQSNDAENRIDLVVEDTSDASHVLGLQRNPSLEREYIETKKAYEKKFDVIWLDPFEFTNIKAGQKSAAASLVRRDVLAAFPLLPRILNKLAGAIDNQSFTQLLDQAKREKPNTMVKFFLESHGLI
nr:hypothetical protein [Desulfobulbaceae bacterium]